MKLAILGCIVTSLSGTEFADGSRVVKVGLEDFMSFNVQPDDPILKKINVGSEFDLTYTFDKTNESTTKSGAAVTYHNLIGARVITSTIKQAEKDPNLEKLDDVTDVSTINFRKVGESTTGTGTGNEPPPRV